MQDMNHKLKYSLVDGADLRTSKILILGVYPVDLDLRIHQLLGVESQLGDYTMLRKGLLRYSSRVLRQRGSELSVTWVRVLAMGNCGLGMASH